MNMITRRLDTNFPFECNATAACPAIFQLDDGDFAIIGTTVTDKLKPELPDGSGCAKHEDIVRVPRETFEDAVKNL